MLERTLLIASDLIAIDGLSKTIKRISIPTYRNIGRHDDLTFARYIELCYGKRFDQDDSVNFNKAWIRKKRALSSIYLRLPCMGLTQTRRFRSNQTGFSRERASSNSRRLCD